MLRRQSNLKYKTDVTNLIITITIYCIPIIHTHTHKTGTEYKLVNKPGIIPALKNKRETLNNEIIYNYKLWKILRKMMIVL